MKHFSTKHVHPLPKDQAPNPRVGTQKRPFNSYPRNSSTKIPFAKSPDASHPPPKLISFAGVLFTSSCYGILFWSLLLAPHCVGVKRRGAVPRGTRLWYGLLISLVFLVALELPRLLAEVSPASLFCFLYWKLC